MNKKATIRVNTPVGTSQPKETGPNVQQGTVEAGVISSGSIDKGVNDTFASSDCELKYLELTINPQIYMDDIFRMAENRDSAQYANNAMKDMVERKLLSFNNDKSSYTLIGNKNARTKLRIQCSNSPLILNGEPMKEVTSVKILGDFICQDLEETRFGKTCSL